MCAGSVRAAPQPSYEAVPADLRAAKAEASEHFFAKVMRRPLAPFVIRRTLAAIRETGGRQIHAIGIGHKMVGGKPGDALCIRFYVTQKLPKRLLAPKAWIDEQIDGIITDVIEAAPAFPAMRTACSRARRERKRPLRPGSSIGNETVAGGTLALRCVSRLPAEAGRFLLLSNSHVLANYGAAPIGSAIYQPSPADGGLPLDRVGTLLRFVPVHEGALATNQVDAAVAMLDDGVNVEEGICAVGFVHGTALPFEGQQVHKHARTTGYSVGVVDDISCDVLLPLSRATPERQARFVNQIRVRARPGASLFAQLGDSGALIVDKPTNRAVGLLFACPDTGTHAFANPIQAVLDHLQIDLG
ncbi:MAG TPA: hypothetical protein PK743_09365 [Luteimonas sp.]|nr:hypothetical protein [Luteimonas sp.]